MELRAMNFMDYIKRFENSDKTYYSFLMDVNALLIELEGHKGRKIRIGNNAFTPLNEEEYEFIDYKVFNCMEGQFVKREAITLIITVKSIDSNEVSFVYSYITHVESHWYPNSSNNGGALKFHIDVRNRCVDGYIDEHDGIEFLKNRFSNDKVDTIRELMNTTYRFTLLE